MLELFAPGRVTLPDFRSLPSRRPCGPGVRYSFRARKLNPSEESTIRALAATKSLRSVAAEFGVSHETVRGVIRR